MDVSSSYDPMIAKIIVVADDRASALEKMALALAETTITGVETNLGYLRQIIGSELFRSGDFTTSSLNNFKVEASVIEVVEAGSQTAVQDFPGRKKFWHIGVPPSGPFDDYSFRLANRIVGNDICAAGLEMTVQGPSLLFHSDAIVAITGAEVEVKIDGEVAKTNIALSVRHGQTLAIGKAINGYRMYLAVRGGVDGPSLLFHSDAIVAITGAEVEVKIDREVAKTNIALSVRRGQTLAIGRAINGYPPYSCATRCRLEGGSRPWPSWCP
ncbi:Urea amidolyase like protein [Verticillium longisporum]|nr:Urea amidolyase like protein [Verticillium longisporum]